MGGEPISGTAPCVPPIPLEQSTEEGQALATADNFHFQTIDLNSQLDELLEPVDRVQPELVVNFAAQGMVAESWLNPTHWYRTNVVAQVALHDELRQKISPEIRSRNHPRGVRQHGWWLDQGTQPLQPYPYAVSRAACDLHLHELP